MEFFASAISARDIYEFDLKQFFPSVIVENVSEILVRHGLPVRLVLRLEKINESIIQKATQGDLMPEVERDKREAYEMTLKELEKRPDTAFSAMAKNLITMGIPTRRIFKGLPQGAPTSPFLSNLISQEALFKKYAMEPNAALGFAKPYGLIMYADDGFFYGRFKELP